METKCVRILAEISNVSVQTVLMVKTIVQVYLTTSVVVIVLEIKPYFVRIIGEFLITGYLYSYCNKEISAISL